MNFTSRFRLNEPNPDPAPGIVVQEEDQGVDIAIAQDRISLGCRYDYLDGFAR
jgi:hypothetical protein